MGQRGKARARPGTPASGDVEAARRALQGCAVMRNLDRRALDDLARNCERARFQRRQSLYGDGAHADAVYVVESGRVRLVRSRGEGGCLTLGYRGPAEFVGESALAGGGVHRHGAIATDPLDALRIPFKHAQRLAEDHIAFCTELLRLFASQLLSVERRLAAVAGRPVESRIAAFLGEQARLCGVPHARGVAIGQKYTHQEIADYVASTRETVTLTLGELRRKGIVAFEKRRLVLVDRAAVERLE